MKNDVKINTKGEGRIFASPLLERMTRTHVVVPVTIFFMYAAGLLYWSITRTTVAPWTTTGLFFLGLFVFTWVEYNVHRFLFHIPTTTPARKRFQYVMHGVHHEFPKDKARLAMPPLVSIAVATVVLLVVQVVAREYSFSIVAGFLVGYAAYLSVHYIIHAYAPPKNFMKALWKNHVLHHYKDGDIAFGVTSPLWDYIYGTHQRRGRESGARVSA